jgi:hypothetical protein
LSAVVSAGVMYLVQMSRSLSDLFSGSGMMEMHWCLLLGG